MAYGLKYSQYLEKGGATLQIRVYVKDYSGASYGMAHLTGASLQMVGGQSDILTPFIKTAFSWSMADCWDEGTTKADGTTCVNAQNEKCGEWEEFYTPDATKFRVELWAKTTPTGTAVCIWTGYVTPDSWSENMTYRGSVTITARDMLGALQDKEFDLTGRVSILDIVQGALSACACPMTLSYTAGHFLVNENGSSILSHTIAASTFAGKTWQQALEETLESLGLVLRYNGANGIVLTSLRYLKADTTSGSHTIEFISNSGLRELDPALRSITETFDVEMVAYNAPDPEESQFARTGGTITCSMTTLRPNHQSETATGQLYAYALTRANNEGWAGTLGIPLYGSIGGGVPSRGIYFPTNVQDTQGTLYADYTNPRINKSFKFRLLQDGPLVKASDGATSSAAFEVYSGVAIILSEINVRVEATANNTTYYLNQQGAWVTDLSYLTLAPGEEVEVPTLNNGSGYKVVVKGLRVIGATDNVRPVAPLLAALLLEIAPNYDSTSPTEFKTTTIYNEENNVTITRKPTIGSATITECIEFYENVLGLGNAIAADRWNWSGESGYYPLAVMIQAQALCYHAAAASVFTGTAHDKNAGAALALPGCGYTYYERNCVPVSGIFDFASGFLAQGNFREVYSWEDVWGASFDPEYTRTQGAGRGSTSATGAGGTAVTPGGGSSGGGGGAAGRSFFEEDSDYAGGVALKSNYDAIRTPGIRFGAGASDLDLEVVMVNGARVIHSRLPFYSDSWISSGGISSGGGGGGGIDLEAMWNSLTNATQDAYANTKIATAHIPDMAGTYNYVKTADLADYATQSWVTTALAGYLPLTGGVLSVNNQWLTSAKLQLMRPDTTSYTDRACIGVTNGNLHIDCYPDKAIYLNYYSGYATIYVGSSQYTVYHTGNLSPLTTTNYSSYCLPLTGGTLQGANANLLRLNNTTANNAVSYMFFQSNGTNKASTGYETDVLGGAAFLANETRAAYLMIPNSGDPVFRVGATGGTNYTIYHSGNLTISNYFSKQTISDANTLLYGAATADNNVTNVPNPWGTVVAFSGSGGYVFQLFGRKDNLLGFRGRDSAGTWDGWNTIYHSGNSNSTSVAWSASSLTLANGGYVYFLDASNNAKGVLRLTGSNNLRIGDDTSTAGYATVINGAPIYLQYGTSQTIGFILNNSGNVTIGSSSDLASTSYKLYVDGASYFNSYLALANNTGIYFKDSGGTIRSQLYVDNTNALTIGYGTITNGTNTTIDGTNIIFRTGSSRTEYMRITSAGNVGIGTNAPGYKLDVKGLTRITRAEDNYGVLIGTGGNVIDGVSPSGYGNIAINYNSTGNVGLCYGGGRALFGGTVTPAAVWTKGTSIFGPDGTDKVIIGYLGTGYNFAVVGAHNSALNAWANLYIGANTQINFYMGGVKAYITSAGNFVANGAVTGGAASDARLKDDISTMDAAYARRVVMSSRPVSFVWNATAKAQYDKLEGSDVGLIAQEAQGVLPSAVSPIWEKYLRIDYTKYVAPMLRVLQDHEDRLAFLEQENAELKRRLNLN